MSDTPNLVCDSERTCIDIESEYDTILENASQCEVDSECQILNGQCRSGISEYYEAVNISLS